MPTRCCSPPPREQLVRAPGGGSSSTGCWGGCALRPRCPRLPGTETGPSEPVRSNCHQATPGTQSWAPRASSRAGLVGEQLSGCGLHPWSGRGARGQGVTPRQPRPEGSRVGAEGQGGLGGRRGQPHHVQLAGPWWGHSSPGLLMARSPWPRPGRCDLQVETVSPRGGRPARNATWTHDQGPAGCGQQAVPSSTLAEPREDRLRASARPGCDSHTVPCPHLALTWLARATPAAHTPPF